jgi:serine protease Do
MNALHAIEEAVTTVAEQVGPAVVGLGAGWGQGSGIVVSAGHVLTNAHNLSGQEVAVSFADGETRTGAVAGADVDGDLAVVAVDTGEVTPVTWSDTDVGLGNFVIALANPGGRGLRATLGFVSSTQRSFRGPRGRRITGSIEHTAPLPRGSSGGPVLDGAGGLVGINTNRIGDGFYLAIPTTERLRAQVDALARGNAPSRVRLGIAIAPPRVARTLRDAVGLPERDGLLVRDVEEDGPAGRAGIRRGDLIVRAGDRSVTTPDELFAVLDAAGDATSLTLQVVRGVDDLTVEAPLSSGD